MGRGERQDGIEPFATQRIGRGAHRQFLSLPGARGSPVPRVACFDRELTPCEDIAFDRTRGR